MAEPARSDARSGGVVRPLSRVATRRCSRPGCPTPATATLAFRYDQQHALLAPLVPDGGPETYDLCGGHADRTRPPHGWTLRDDRPAEPDDVRAPDATELGSEHTVAVLAAALRGDGVVQPTADVDAPAVEAPEDDRGDAHDVDVDALDAIASQPFDEPDLFGAVDETDPVVAPEPDPGSTEALTELSALSAATPTGDASDGDHGVVEQVPARTVPGAHRPA